VLTPYGGLALSGDNVRSYRLGGRLELRPTFHLDLAGERREAATGPANRSVMLMLRLGTGRLDNRAFRDGFHDRASRYGPGTVGGHDPWRDW
jgi:hypothetical protein